MFTGPSTPTGNEQRVLTCAQLGHAPLRELLARYDLELVTVAAGEPIPGTWFGEPEAGVIANRIYVRPDTPIHSALHESGHYICMSPERRDGLHTDAGGGYDEENGVCYLQILLADELAGMGRARMWSDMDDWGYTYRLGSARRWFEEDAADARRWLLDEGLIDAHDAPTWRLRTSPD
ncbi:hypothetical protein [Endothiovibrio diazotrophicus]